MFYWMAVLWTFALGTSTGDQMSEDGAFGYWRSIILISICVLIYIIKWITDWVLRPRPPTWIGILCFWLVYILTRPLGASIGDFLAADKYPQYDPTNCNDPGTNTTVVGCSDGDVYCIINCNKYPTYILPTDPNYGGSRLLTASTTTKAP
jgi:hypothetical protein